jgi:hypothetical protein
VVFLRQVGERIGFVHARVGAGSARIPAEFIEALRRFRTWAGNPSFRDMARACNGRPTASTMGTMLAGGDLLIMMARQVIQL